MSHKTQTETLEQVNVSGEAMGAEGMDVEKKAGMDSWMAKVGPSLSLANEPCRGTSLIRKRLTSTLQ